jgi:hypothetical protein
MLSHDHPRLLFLTVGSPCSSFPGPDGNAYRYFIQYARKSGLLLDHPPRAAALRALTRGQNTPEQVKEFRTRLALDRLCHFSDFWNAITYQQFGTIWNPCLGDRFHEARHKLPDPEPGATAMAPVSAEQEEREVALIRQIACRRKDVELNVRQCQTCCPPSMRARTLFLILHDNPKYLARLTDDERQGYLGFPSRMVIALREGGFEADKFGQDYPADHFLDRCHLTEPGGRQLAEDVAPVIREQARKLGYLEVK